MEHLEILVHSFDEITKAYDILDDEKSKKVFRYIIGYRLIDMSYNISKIKDYTRLQYFDPSIIKLFDNEVFVDAGVFDGETSISFKDFCKNRFKKIYMLEPDEDSFNMVKKRIDALNDSRFILIKKGLYNKNSILKFNSNSASASIDKDGDIEVEVAKLDDLIQEEVTFIKMDIEGSEIPALYGAENIIKKYNPKLAISIYHNPKDLWEIPLLIKKLNNNYKIYIRHYTANFYETVCYAI